MKGLIETRDMLHPVVAKANDLRTGKLIHQNHPFMIYFRYHIKNPSKKQELGVDKMKKR